jgi:HEAT repeat protein
MNLETLFKDKTIKGKEKTQNICQWLLDETLPIDELIVFAEAAKHAVKATCIEGIEQATKQNAQIANEHVFKFVTEALVEKEPRVKWESARVIGNTAHLNLTLLEKAIENLLKNTQHEGTVVRWSAAYALGEIIKLKTNYNQKLFQSVNEIIANEEKNSIKKIYIDAIKKANK